MRYPVDSYVVYKGKKLLVWDYSNRYKTYSLLDDRILHDKVYEDEIIPYLGPDYTVSAENLAHSFMMATRHRNGGYRFYRELGEEFVLLYDKGHLTELGFFDLFIEELRQLERDDRIVKSPTTTS